NTTFEIGLGAPRNFIAPATPGSHPNVERWQRWSNVSNGSVLDVFDPDLGYLFVRQPGRFKRVTLVGRSRDSRLAKEGRQPSLAHVHRLEVLTIAVLGWQAHGQAGVKESNRQ